MAPACYADASALTKVVVAEPDSAALTSELHTHDQIVTSIISRVEVERAVRRRADIPPADIDEALRTILGSCSFIPLDLPIAAAAGALSPAGVRSLDAIHLGSMLAVREDIDVCYCYDKRLSDAAREHGIDVSAPA